MNRKLKFIVSLIVFVFSLGMVIAITASVLTPDFPVKNISNWTSLFIILFPLGLGALKSMFDAYNDSTVVLDSEKFARLDSKAKTYISIFIFCGITGSIAAYFSYRMLVFPLISICLIGVLIIIVKEKKK